MKDQNKTKKQLMDKLTALRQRVAELEKSEAERLSAEQAGKWEEVQYKRKCGELQTIMHSVRPDIFYIDRSHRFVCVNKAFGLIEEARR